MFASEDIGVFEGGGLGKEENLANELLLIKYMSFRFVKTEKQKSSCQKKANYSWIWITYKTSLLIDMIWQDDDNEKEWDMRTYFLTIAAKGEPYVMIFRPAHKNPKVLICASSCRVNLVIKIAATGKPTSKIAAIAMVLALNIMKKKN